MPLFTKTYNLKEVWRDIKKDAEKARGGKKPGGGMGFEPLLDNLDKAVQSRTPNVNTIMIQTGQLVSQMRSYAAHLPGSERKFADDITGFCKTLTEIARACDINAKQVAALQVGAQQGELLAAFNAYSRFYQIGDALYARLNKLRAAQKSAQTSQEELAVLKEIVELEDSIRELAEDMAHYYEKTRNLVGGPGGKVVRS
jgi:hypothetical protein